MNHEQAHQILDQVKEGRTYPSCLVDFALFLTGDLDALEEDGSPGMAQAIPNQSPD